MRNHGIEIPIDSTGRFNYELRFHNIEAYELIFKDERDRGAWRPIEFFPDNDKIEFSLYPMDLADSNLITGSQLSLKKDEYEKLIRDKYYSRYIYWEQRMDSLANSNEPDTDYLRIISDTMDAIGSEVAFFELRHVTDEQNIYGYSNLLRILRNEKDRHMFDIDTLKRYCSLFEEKFPDHPYNEIAQYRLNGLINIRVGGECNDFTALDMDGTAYTFSDLISGSQLTLLDLWASWCAPCIYKSQKLIPVYEKYKDSGFNVVGVVGGIASQEEYKEVVEKYNYQWLVLAEINDENKLWEKYGASKGGGGQFLIDSKGKIVAINPSPEELEKFINGR